MVKRKSLPKPAEKAGYAAQTAPRISDSTSETSSSAYEELTSAQSSPRKSLTTTKLSKLNTTKPKSKKMAPVLRQIRELQKTTNLLIPKAPFIRLVHNFFLNPVNF